MILQPWWPTLPESWASWLQPSLHHVGGGGEIKICGVTLVLLEPLVLAAYGSVWIQFYVYGAVFNASTYFWPGFLNRLKRVLEIKDPGNVKAGVILILLPSKDYINLVTHDWYITLFCLVVMLCFYIVCIFIWQQCFRSIEEVPASQVSVHDKQLGSNLCLDFNNGLRGHTFQREIAN